MNHCFIMKTNAHITVPKLHRKRQNFGGKIKALFQVCERMHYALALFLLSKSYFISSSVSCPSFLGMLDCHPQQNLIRIFGRKFMFNTCRSKMSSFKLHPNGAPDVNIDVHE